MNFEGKGHKKTHAKPEQTPKKVTSTTKWCILAIKMSHNKNQEKRLPLKEEGPNKMAQDYPDIQISSLCHKEDASQQSATNTAGQNYILYSEACHNEGRTKCTIQSTFLNATIEEVLEHVARSNNSLHYLTLG